MLQAACATGGYAGPQFVVSTDGEMSLEVMATAAVGPISVDANRDRTTAVRMLGLDAFVGYNLTTSKLVGGFGNTFNISLRSTSADSGHEFRIGSRFRFGGGHGFQLGVHWSYAFVRALKTKRDVERCPAEAARTEFPAWLAPALGIEVLFSKPRVPGASDMRGNFSFGTVAGGDNFLQGDWTCSQGVD